MTARTHGRPHSVAPLGNQATSTTTDILLSLIILTLNQPSLIMPSAWLESDKYLYSNHLFDATRVQSHEAGDGGSTHLIILPLP